MNAYRLGAAPRGRRAGRGGQNASSQISAQQTRRHRPDYVLVILMTILLGVGAVTVYAISPGITSAAGLSENYYSSKQLAAIALGIIAFLVSSAIGIGMWKRIAMPLVIFASVVALAVRVVGDQVNGAYRWLQVGGFSFQAAELIKLALVVWLAGYLATRLIDQKMAHPDTLQKVGIVVGVIVIVVAGIQSDLGSAAVMMAMVGVMVFIAGMPMKKLLIIASVVLLLSSVAILGSSYRRDRVSTFLNPTADCQNEGFQVCQALIAVGSGGIAGKGLGRSVQAYGYLPEPANDSIFAIVSEKFGFIGSALILGVFALLFRRIKAIAEAAPNSYSRLLVTGILVWLSVQMIINVGAMLGLLPLKGITLPFVSYGGTSIIFVMVAMGIVFQVSRYTDLGKRPATRTYGHSKTSNSTRIPRKSWGQA